MAACPPGLVKDARFSYALACWHRWRGSRRFPARADIDPVDLKHLLPHLFMVEVTAEGRFRFILSGKTVRENLGFELSGRHLDELFAGEQLAQAETAYHAVMRGDGDFAASHWLRRGRAVMLFRRLMLPLATDHQQIDAILGFALYERLDGHGTTPIDHMNDPVTVQLLEQSVVPLD